MLLGTRKLGFFRAETPGASQCSDTINYDSFNSYTFHSNNFNFHIFNSDSFNSNSFNSGGGGGCKAIAVDRKTKGMFKCRMLYLVQKWSSNLLYFFLEEDPRSPLFKVF